MKQELSNLYDEIKALVPAIDHLEGHSLLGNEEADQSLAILNQWRLMFEARISQIEKSCERIRAGKVTRPSDNFSPSLREDADKTFNMLLDARRRRGDG